MKFSIIVPVYNVAPYLHECLESVLAQTFADWECICVDDGSTDGSGTILDEYAKMDSRFRVVRQANAGVSAARNAGMELATGEYLTFLDADDLYAPGWLDMAKHLIDDVKPDLLRMNRTMFHGAPPNDIPVSSHHVIIDDCKAIQTWGWETLVDNGFCWELFQRKEDAVRYRFPDGVTMSEDEIRSLKITRDVKRICVSDYAGYLYRGRSDSAVSHLLSAKERLHFLDEYETLVPDAEHLPKYAQQLWECVTGWMRRHECGDWRNRNQIRRRFREIVAASGVKAVHMKPQWRLPFVLYLRFGVVTPIFATRWLLRSVVMLCPRLAKDRNR